LQKGCGLLHLGLELFGERFSLGSHDILLLGVVPHSIDEQHLSKSTARATRLAFSDAERERGDAEELQRPGAPQSSVAWVRGRRRAAGGSPPRWHARDKRSPLAVSRRIGCGPST